MFKVAQLVSGPFELALCDSQACVLKQHATVNLQFYQHVKTENGDGHNDDEENENKLLESQDFVFLLNDVIAQNF